MFAIFVTVVSKFNSCPHCEKIDLKIIQSMGRTGLNMQKIQEPKKMCYMEDFSEEQWPV